MSQVHKKPSTVKNTPSTAILRDQGLDKNEKLRVCLATACGCLDVMHYLTPGADHSKKKRTLKTLREMLIKQTGRCVPGIAKRRNAIFTDHVRAADTVIKALLKEQENHVNVTLNLAYYAASRLPISDNHIEKMAKLVEMWPEAFLSEKERLEDSGAKIFARINKQAETYTFEREGVPL